MVESLETDRPIDRNILEMLISKETIITYRKTTFTSKVDSPNWGYFVFKSKGGESIIVDCIGNIYKHTSEVLYSRDDLSHSTYIGRCYNLWRLLESVYPFKLTCIKTVS